MALFYSGTLAPIYTGIDTWPELKGNGGHGLASLKSHLNLQFHHHDGEEDARAAAEIVLLAEKRTGLEFGYSNSVKEARTRMRIY